MKEEPNDKKTWPEDIPEETKAAIEKEMETMYTWVFEHYETAEVTETRTETRKALRWKEKA